jgi:hypothetical protein
MQKVTTLCLGRLKFLKGSYCMSSKSFLFHPSLLKNRQKKREKRGRELYSRKYTFQILSIESIFKVRNYCFSGGMGERRKSFELL